MRWKRTVPEPARSKQPSATVGFEDERIRAGVPVQPAALLIGRRVGGLSYREIRDVDPRPRARVGVPPDVLFSLRPGLAGRVRGGPVVEHAPVAGPGESPFGIDIVVRTTVSATRHILPRRRKDSGINPDAAGCGAVILQSLVIRQLAVIGDGKAVDLHQDLLGGGLVADPPLRVGLVRA